MARAGAKKVAKKGKYNSHSSEVTSSSPDSPALEASRIKCPHEYRSRSGSGGL